VSRTHSVGVSEFGELPPVATFRTVLLDLDGTVYLDGDALPGAQEFIAECVASGCLVSYITNLSLFPKSHCLDALERIGMATTPRQVLTAVDVLMTTLDGRVRGRRIGVIAAQHVRDRLRIAGYRVTDLNAGPAAEPLDALVVGQVSELHRNAREHVTDSIDRQLPIFATSTHGQMPTRLAGVMSAGQVLAALVGSADLEVVDCGKPSTYFAAAVDELMVLADPVLVIGDSLASDIALAKGNGWFGMLVGDRPVGSSGPVPDYWAPDLGSALGR
jgi:HAD superfamily hydrolase (TIGR01450 family)